jgi:hypothetical protein
MIFQATWQAVLDGSKSETRRICKPGEWLSESKLGAPTAVYVGSLPHEHLKWMIGRTYAVQTGRGNPGLYYKRTPAGLSVWDWDSLPRSRMPRNIKSIPSDYIAARIRLLEIRQERLQDITEAGAIAEGCRECTILDGDWYSNTPAQIMSAREVFEQIWYGIHPRKGERWDNNPLVWVLRFELAEKAE